MASSILGQSCVYYDLSYNLDEQTIFWPGGEGFSLCLNCDGDADSDSFYSAGIFKCAEHAGTHVDAPFHFNFRGLTVDKLAMSSLIAYCHVIDIRHVCLNTPNGRNYELQVSDIHEHERQYGDILEGNIVLIRTGWSKYYPQGSLAYLGFDEKLHGKYDSATSNLSFPGIGVEAAKLFVQKKVAAVGLDTGI